MLYIGLALVAAIVGVLPLLLRQKLAEAVVVGFIAFLIDSLIFYAGAISLALWPILGGFGLMVFVFWLVSAIVDAASTDDLTWTAIFPVAALVLYMIIGMAGCSAFRANDYAGLMTKLGPEEEKIWTKHVQPKSEEHMRMANTENAVFQAQKVLGQAGAIGSQFSINTEHMTLQMVNGELWYVAPLDFNGFSVWLNTEGSPGYIKVHGEDPHRQPELVMMPQKMKYTPGAFWGNNLERYMRENGYLNQGIGDWTFEIDESGRPWWAITVFKPTITWWGEMVTGVALVDPISGAVEFHPMGQIPDWVDRVVPRGYIANYLEKRGMLSDGWLNSWWGKKCLTKPEIPNLIYGNDNQPEWVTGITSASSADDSLVALVYTNSRTGHSVRYEMKGGATDTAVMDNVNQNSQVKFRHLHAVAPQLYNILGMPVSVVPLLNDSHAFQGVAMVPINDIQSVAVGNNQYEALRELEKLIAEGGQRITVDKERAIETAEGKVIRFGYENLSNSGTVYYVFIDGRNQLFTAGSGESPKLPVTKEGDVVRIEYYASDRDVVPMRKFDNLSLNLTASTTQKDVRQRVEERRQEQEVKQDLGAVLERIKQMTPDELKKLEGQMPK